MSQRRILPTVVGAIAAGFLAVGAASCASRNPTTPSSSSNGVPDLVAEAAFCVDEINRLRATVGAAPLVRSEEVEAFSTEASRVDGDAHIAHKYFRDTNGGNGTSTAENEIPWWSLSQWGSVRSIVRRGLAMEWAEGPGGGHYENMTGIYTRVACGFSVRNDEVTVTQDFR